MAKYILNKGGHQVVLLNQKESESLHFGVEGQCYCDSCSRQIEDRHYYIAALNSVFCENCCIEYCNNYNAYPEDYGYVINKMNKISKVLAESGNPIVEFDAI